MLLQSPKKERKKRSRAGREMSSSLEEMVHDFMELETTNLAPTSAPLNHHEYSSCVLLQGILASATDTEMEILDKATMHVNELGDERKSDQCVTKRLMMRLRMDGYDASLCRSSWVSTLDCPGGDYEYIVIVMATSDERVIVDTEFSSQFELARPTSAYRKLSNQLPSIFVGNEDKLKKLVSLLCSASQKSLKESGLHIPPWRKFKYVQSKWLPCFHEASTITLTFPVHSRIWPM